MMKRQVNDPLDDPEWLIAEQAASLKSAAVVGKRAVAGAAAIRGETEGVSRTERGLLGFVSLLAVEVAVAVVENRRIADEHSVHCEDTRG